MAALARRQAWVIGLRVFHFGGFYVVVLCVGGFLELDL